MFINLDKKDYKFIKEFLNQDYNIVSLKNWRSFIRKKILKYNPITPYPYTIVTNKDKYKILVAEKNYEFQIQEILNNLSFIDNLYISPKVQLYRKNFIIVEYIEGEFPNFNDKYFVNCLAEIFAKLHLINLTEKNNDEIFTNIFRYKNILESLELNCDMIMKIIEKNLPKTILSSFSYVDHNRGNYILDKKKELRMIDLGSFVSNTTLDLHLISSAMFQNINQKEFWITYRSINKNTFIYENQDILRFIALINSLIYNYQRYTNAPKFDFRLKKAKRLNVLTTLNNIKSNKLYI